MAFKERLGRASFSPRKVGTAGRAWASWAAGLASQTLAFCPGECPAVWSAAASLPC